MNQTKVIGIGLVLYPGVQQAAVLGLSDLFSVANTIAAEYQQHTILQVTHWQSPAPERDPTCTGDSVHSSCALSALILPPTLSTPVIPDRRDRLIQWLRDRHAQGVVLGSVCAGAFLLAATGLMAGRRMTTHWKYGELLQQHFPDIDVDADRLVIDDGDVISAGGLMSWTDLGLRLVDRLLGPTVMIHTARTLLVDPPGREQRYYSVFSPRLNHGDAAILKVQHWLRLLRQKMSRLAPWSFRRAWRSVPFCAVSRKQRE